MLSAARNSHKLSTNSYLIIRCLATEAISSSSSSDLPPPKHPNSSSSKPKPRSSLYPRPRPARSPPLPDLPPTFGRNQLLPVSNSTRALLESIVAQFDAPIRYAFAYGSGVFEQDGYGASATTSPTTGITSITKPTAPDAPMLDFMFAVTHPAHFHSINMAQHPSHYTFDARMLGSDYVSALQAINPGVWFNTLVPMNGVVSRMILFWDALFIVDLLDYQVWSDNCRQSLLRPFKLEQSLPRRTHA